MITPACGQRTELAIDHGLISDTLAEHCGHSRNANDNQESASSLPRALSGAKHRRYVAGCRNRHSAPPTLNEIAFATVAKRTKERAVLATFSERMSR